MNLRSPGSSPFLRVFFWILASATALVAVGSVAWHGWESAGTIARRLDGARPWLALWRAALFLTLIGAWPRLIAWAGARQGWSVQRRRFLVGLRWRAALWLLLIELVLVQRVAGRLIAGLLP